MRDRIASNFSAVEASLLVSYSIMLYNPILKTMKPKLRGFPKQSYRKVVLEPHSSECKKPFFNTNLNLFRANLYPFVLGPLWYFSLPYSFYISCDYPTDALQRFTSITSCLHLAG